MTDPFDLDAIRAYPRAPAHTRAHGKSSIPRQHGNTRETTLTARKWLDTFLAQEGGVARLDDVHREGVKAGHTISRLTSARQYLGIRSVRTQVGWCWQLPPKVSVESLERSDTEKNSVGGVGERPLHLAVRQRLADVDADTYDGWRLRGRVVRKGETSHLNLPLGGGRPVSLFVAEQTDEMPVNDLVVA